MVFFDCNCSIGEHPRPPFRYAKNPAELLAEMDFCGIDQALVYHTGMRFGSPIDWNELLYKALEKEVRLLTSWAILPSQTAEWSEPETLIEEMRVKQIHALRAFPQEHHYTLDARTFGGLFKSLSEKKIPLFIKDNLLSVYKFIESFPELRVILMNQGPHSFERYLRPLLDTYTNVYLESSYYIIEGAIEEFCARYGPERLLFGTAFPDNCSGGSLLQLLHADIDQAAREAIAGANLQRLLAEVEL